MDHHGRMETSGHQVHVSVRDPGNVTVKYWHHRLLWPGLTNFLFELSDRPPTGLWSVHVALKGHRRRVSFSVVAAEDADLPTADVPTAVTSPRAKTPDAQTNSTSAVYAAESHFVELNFSRRTAVHFVPHLPFAGEVLSLFFLLQIE